MPDEPTYLGLLNAISLAESRAHAYFDAWIAVTPNPDVRKVLQTVSCREGEHGLAFAKRIDELGYELVPKDDPRHEEAMRVAASDLPDVEKFRRLGLADFQLTYFDNVFSDHSIDIQTGALLGRYIAEEFDSLRRLHECYELLAGEEGPSTGARPKDGLVAQVEELCRAVEELRDTVAVQGGVLDELRQVVGEAQRKPPASQSGAAANGKHEAKRARR